MKRVSMFCLTLLMIAALVVPAFAANAFVSSPSGKTAPTIVTVTPDSEDCEAEIVITAYGDRSNLSEEARALLEKAYEQIANAAPGTDFYAILDELAKSLKLSASDLAVSDLFDIDTTHCADHDNHGGFTITIKVADAGKLAGMLHFKQIEQWENCEILDLDVEAGTLTFHGTEFSPFALVVTTGDAVVDTDGGSNLWWIILLIVVGVAAVGAALWFFVFKKKDKAAA